MDECVLVTDWNQTLLSGSPRRLQNVPMESANIQDLYDEWQRAVRAHVNLVRDGKMRGLTSSEIDNIGHAYLLRIDAAYARLKQAESQQGEAAIRLQIWKDPPISESSSVEVS
jgi:hypothetical protein